MATLEDIMRGLKSQEGDDKKVEFFNALLGLNPQGGNNGNTEVYNNLFRQAPATPLGSSFTTDFQENIKPYAFGEDPLTREILDGGLKNQLDLYLTTPKGDQFNGLLGASKTPFGEVGVNVGGDFGQSTINGNNGQTEKSPFLPSGEKAVYAMTPEEVAARQAGRNRLLDDSMIGSLGSLVGDLVLGKNRGVSSSSPLSTNLPPTFTPPSEGANPISDSIGRLFGFTKDREPISLVELGLESPQQAALREQFNPTQTLITPTFNSGVQAEPSTQPSDTLQTGQVTPTIQSITGVEQAQEQAPQPQATFTLPSEEVRSIMPEQDVASAFGRESSRPMTFQVGGGEVTIPSVEAIAQTMNLSDQAAARQAQQDMAIQTMNLGEQAAARKAQQEFLASPAAREMSNRMLRSVMYNDPYAQASAERVARMEAKPDFNRAVSDSERRGTGEMSMADATKLTGGDRDAARAIIERQRQGRDPMTGQVVKDQGELTFDQKLAQNKFDFDVAKFSFEQEKEASDATTALRKSEEAAKYAVRDTLRQNENVMRKAQRAGQNIGFTTTGATGALFGMIPGTGAYDQKATVETLQADAAFSTLQRMRDASKTGGALGNVSERELDLLMGAVGNLKIGQSEEQFRNNLAEYVNLRNEALLNIYDAFAADYSPEAANEAFKISSREDLIPSETGSSQSRGTPVETQSGRYEVTTI